jgi:2-dehydropantoate 2-reductase
LKIAVMGAGAVGCYYGAKFSRVGHNVTLIGRAPLVDAIKRGGLRLETTEGVETVALAATTDPALVAAADLVFVCVKSRDSASAAEAIVDHLGPNALVVSLQNGVDNATVLEAKLGRPVLAAAVYVAVEMADTGHVRHYGRGEITLADGPGAATVAKVFGDAGVSVDLSGDAAGALWRKLVINCAYNAISGIAQISYGRMVGIKGVPETMRGAIDECLAVAERRNVRLPADTVEAAMALAATMPDQRSSMAQDLARGRRTEIESLNGFIVELGENYGVSTPVNRTLAALVRLLEEREAST